MYTSEQHEMEQLTKLIRRDYKTTLVMTSMSPPGYNCPQTYDFTYNNIFSELFPGKQEPDYKFKPAEMQLLLVELKKYGCNVHNVDDYIRLLEGLRADERTQKICSAMEMYS